MTAPTSAVATSATPLSSAAYWKRYGQYVLMAMPYADEVLVEASGCTLRDADGREMLDLAAGMFCSVLGHNHPRFVERITAQMRRLLHTGTQFLSPAVLQASAQLASVAPGKLQKSIFLSTGTEANEFAFRLAKAWTGRTSIVGLSRGYYGTSLATRSCSSLFSHRLKDTLPIVPGSLRIPITEACSSCFSGNKDRSPCEFPCLDTFEEQAGDWSDIAAIIAEPVLSAGGMLFPPPGYMTRLKEMAKRNGALLIIDEAQTGFGRTGKWFAIEHHDVEPDILTLSKSVGNGFAVAAVITTAEIADKVVSDGLWNLSSHQSDPVAAEAVAAVIEIAREENLPTRAEETGAYFMSRLRELGTRQSAVRNVRGVGLMIGFDCLPPEYPGREAEAANAFMHECRHRGLHLTYGYGGYNIRIIPPLILTREQVDFAVQTIEDALAEVLRNPGNWKNATPKNPHTSRVYAQNSWKRLLSHCWRTSPEEWVEKGSRLLSRMGK
jgi:2,2-dialkylglycine decarboxylase (pyruvate)